MRPVDERIEETDLGPYRQLPDPPGSDLDLREVSTPGCVGNEQKVLVVERPGWSSTADLLVRSSAVPRPMPAPGGD
jgi:hypothetical protein